MLNVGERKPSSGILQTTKETSTPKIIQYHDRYMISSQIAATAQSWWNCSSFSGYYFKSNTYEDAVYHEKRKIDKDTEHKMNELTSQLQEAKDDITQLTYDLEQAYKENNRLRILNQHLHEVLKRFSTGMNETFWFSD